MPSPLRLLIAVLIALGTLGISAAQPTHAAGTQVADCSFPTLQTDLHAGGEWFYAAGQCPSPIIFTSAITIVGTASLTAQGKDVTLDGGHTSTGTGVTLFILGAGSTFGLTGLTLAHGYSTAGGAIFSFGALTITDSTLSNNAADSNGGAIDNNGAGTITITNSTLSGNSVSLDTGEGGAIDNGSVGPLTITGSTLSGNSAPKEGGAIDNDGPLTITDSKLSGNSGGNGGAIWNDDAVTITGSNISGNVASLSGGAIWNDGTVSIADNALSGHSTLLSGNSAALAGGAIYNNRTDDTVTITNSIVAGNLVSRGDGGAIYNKGKLTVTGSTLSGNSTLASGGAIANITTNALTITGSTITSNQAPNGGGIIEYTGTLTITNSTFSGNVASAFGGAIFNSGGAGARTITSSTLADNAARFGGAIAYAGTNPTLSIGGSIVASSTGGNCNLVTSASATDTGYNLEWSGAGHTDTCGFGAPGKHDITGTNPRLGALATNPHLPQTMALTSTSPANDRMPAARCPTTDQRGVARPDTGEAVCDIGAYEFDGPDVMLNIRSSGSPSRYQSARFTVVGAWQMHAVFTCGAVKVHDFHLTVHKAGGRHATVHDVHVRASAGNQTDRYPTGGSYYLLVQSRCRWQITVTGTRPAPKPAAAWSPSR